MKKDNLNYNKYIELKDTLNCETVAETTNTITIIFKKDYSQSYSTAIKGCGKVYAKRSLKCGVIDSDGDLVLCDECEVSK